MLLLNHNFDVIPNCRNKCILTLRKTWWLNVFHQIYIYIYIQNHTQITVYFSLWAASPIPTRWLCRAFQTPTWRVYCRICVRGWYANAEPNAKCSIHPQSLQKRTHGEHKRISTFQHYNNRIECKGKRMVG